ncbi:MAG TPA: hypothetical protein VHE30_17120 [Polyangiaceae bacterium]|nr:hypothetical protein [Polyangiaceae bacterium]
MRSQHVLGASTVLLLAVGIPLPAHAAALTCLVGEHSPELNEWAQYVATLTCDGLRDGGIPVGSPVTRVEGGKADYTVTFARDGDGFSVAVESAMPRGETKRRLWAHLNSLDDTYMVVSGFVRTLTWSASDAIGARQRTRSAAVPHRWAWYFGLEGGLGILPTGALAWNEGRFSTHEDLALRLFLSFETGRIAVVGGLGGAAATHGSSSDASIGGRYYLSEKTTSAFVGAGLGYSYIREEAGTDTYAPPELCLLSCAPWGEPESFAGTLGGEGWGALVEAGVTIRRRVRFPVTIAARAHVPFYRLKRESSPPYELLTQDGPMSRYEVPVELTVGIGFL